MFVHRSSVTIKKQLEVTDGSKDTADEVKQIDWDKSYFARVVRRVFTRMYEHQLAIGRNDLHFPSYPYVNNEKDTNSNWMKLGFWSEQPVRRQDRFWVSSTLWIIRSANLSI